jgi:hypothetical protein
MAVILKWHHTCILADCEWTRDMQAPKQHHRANFESASLSALPVQSNFREILVKCKHKVYVNECGMMSIYNGSVSHMECCGGGGVCRTMAAEQRAARLHLCGRDLRWQACHRLIDGETAHIHPPSCNLRGRYTSLRYWKPKEDSASAERW